MTRKYTSSKKYINRRSSGGGVAGLVMAAIMTLAVSLTQSCSSRQRAHNPQNATANNQVETPKELQNVEVISVYDGDTFKINIPCDMKVFCEKVNVRVRGVDAPEIKGKTEREKELAQKAKAFTQDFLKKKPISLNNCGRDKYFRLLCNVSNNTGKDLAQELINADLGYEYWGGAKSKQYQ